LGIEGVERHHHGEPVKAGELQVWDVVKHAPLFRQHDSARARLRRRFAAAYQRLHILHGGKGQ